MSPSRDARKMRRLRLRTVFSARRQSTSCQFRSSLVVFTRLSPRIERLPWFYNPCVASRACYELCEDTAASGEHEAGESDEVQSFQGFRQSFIVPGEATEPGSPGEEPFHNPSTR